MIENIGLKSAFQLRPMSDQDHSTVREVYVDAIQFQDQAFYTKNKLL